MPVDDSAEILQELCGLIHDELKALSYKWVARHYSISANNAKRVLFQLAEQQRDKVRTVYLVSGWTKQEPPSHVHQLVEADQLQVCRESLGEVTGMHVYSVAPNQATNPDSLWQITYQQSQQLLKEILSGQPSASAEIFRSNSCSAVRYVTQPPQQSQQQRLPTAAVQSARASKAAAPRAAQPQPPQYPESRAKPPAADHAVAGSAAAPQAAATDPNGTGPADRPAKASGASPPKTGAPSPPKVAGAKAPGKAAGPAKSSRLANMWSKAPAKSKTSPSEAQAPSVEVSPTARPAQEPLASGEEEEDEGMAVHVAAGSNRGRKRRGAQIHDSEDEAGEEPAGEAGGAAVAAGAAGAAAGVEPREPQRQGRGGKGSKARGAGKTPKEDKETTAGAAKRAKTVLATDTPAVTETAASSSDGADMDEAVVDALEAAAAVAPQELLLLQQQQQQQQPASMKSMGAAGGRVTHARKATRTYINDKGEEVTEEVWEDGPPPPPPQQQQQPAVQVAATGHAKGPGAAAAATKPAAKGPAPSSKAAKGKAPTAGQKSMTAFFSKK